MLTAILIKCAIAFIVISVIFSALFSLASRPSKADKERAERRNNLKQKYLLALQGTDKQYALSCGREYFASLHNNSGYSTNTLTLAEEQTMANDISVMKEAEI